MTLLDQAALDYDLKVGRVSSCVRRTPRPQRNTYNHEFESPSIDFPPSPSFQEVYSADYHHHYDDIPPLDLDASIYDINAQLQRRAPRPLLVLHAPQNPW